MTARGRHGFSARVDHLATPAFWIALLLMVALVVICGPVQTSDGPAHVTMAHFMVRQGDPQWPMLNRLYEVNPHLSPNALGHDLLAGFMLIVPPLVAEQLLQVLCLVSIPLAARLTLRRLAPDAGWLALFFIPVALQNMFFMGLYNYCLSVTFCLLSIWAFLRLQGSLRVSDGVMLGLFLLIAFASQASGWIEAVVAIGTIVTTDTALRMYSGESARSAVRLPAATLAAMLPGLVLFVAFMMTATGERVVVYGSTPLERLVLVVRGDAFAPIGRATAAASLAMGAVLLLLFSTGLAEVLRRPAGGNGRLRAGMCLLPVSFIGLLMVIPDQAGGGWTHVWRAEPFPYIGLALACATLPTSLFRRTAAVITATAGGAIAISMAIWVQIGDVAAATKEFMEADHLIGPHCTVAPILGQFKADPANTARLFYHPMFHIANRLELTGDRPVLFSYVARLPVYPVRFRPQADPQALLFGWLPSQRDTRVYKLDVAGFEKASGIPVDYVLLWDIPPDQDPGAYRDLRAAVAQSHYQLAYRSSGGRMELYRRPGSGGCVAR